MKHEVLAIRHVYFEDLGSLEHVVLGDRGHLVRYLDVGRGRIDAPNPLDPSLLVVLGGPIGAYEDAHYPHLAPLLSMLERRVAAGLPTIGICLGSQLIARVYPSGTPELGWLPLRRPRRGARPRYAISKPTARPFPSSTGTAIPSISPMAQRCSHRRRSARIRHSRGGEHVLALQCHPEVLADRFESWLVTYPGLSRRHREKRHERRETPRGNRAARRRARTRGPRDVRRMAQPLRIRRTLTCDGMTHWGAPLLHGTKPGAILDRTFSSDESPHERVVHPCDLTQPAAPESHFRLADVSVLGGARRNHRVAHDPSRPARVVGRGYVVHRGDRRRARRTHHVRRSRLLGRRDRSRAASGARGDPPVFEDRRDDAALACGPQGIEPQALGRRCADLRRRWRLDDVRAIRDCAQARRDAAARAR